MRTLTTKILVNMSARPLVLLDPTSMEGPITRGEGSIRTSQMPIPSTWKSHNTSTPQKVIYERPLGYRELCFYWGSHHGRMTDTLHHAEIEIRSPTAFEETLTISSITAIWVGLKQKFPLLGACLEERATDSIFFVVDEASLGGSRPGEVVLRDIDSADEANSLAHQLTNSKKVLSNSLLGCVFVLRRTDKQSFHLLIYLAHCITDGMANVSLLRTFLEQISRKPAGHMEGLKDRLALSLAVEDLNPQLSFARRQWRKAAARIIMRRRERVWVGGHTLPRRISQKTPYLAADSARIACSLPADKSTTILQNCRKHQVTFGHAYPILAQVAMTRVLLRRYLCGEIGEEEWQFRKNQPMFNTGAINLRPFLDEDWLRAGGRENVCLALSFYIYRLLPMPLGDGKLASFEGIPDYQYLLSPKMFFLRCRGIKAQASGFTKHPLFNELSTLMFSRSVERMKNIILQLRAGGPANSLGGENIPVTDQAGSGYVDGHGGSSMGDLDLLIPKIYPFDGEGSLQNARLHIVKWETHLRCQPGELYLGASTFHKQLRLHVFWDRNVFDGEMISEWLDEVRMATEFYLGGDDGDGKVASSALS